MFSRTVFRAGAAVLVLLALTCPVCAFTAKTLDISILDNTDAVVTFDYDLSWYESAAVFANIVNPGAELAKAIRSQYHKDVAVSEITPSRVRLTVNGFASRSDKDGIVTMKTPALSFQNAERVLERYWFARFVQPDFSPDVTRVTFPDGYTETFTNQADFPALTHVIAQT